MFLKSSFKIVKQLLLLKFVLKQVDEKSPIVRVHILLLSEQSGLPCKSRFSKVLH